MRYGAMEKGMWICFCNCFRKEIELRYGKKFARDTMKKGKPIYKDIIKRTPSIGGMKNQLTINLTNCAMFIAIYKGCNKKISDEVMGEIYENAMKRNYFAREFFKKSKNIFTEKGQKRLKKISELSKESRYELDWKFDFIEGKTIDEFGLTFYSCGICKLTKQEGCFELARQMCKFDYVMVDYMGANLKRTDTIGNGGKLCDFWYSKR